MVWLLRRGAGGSFQTWKYVEHEQNSLSKLLGGHIGFYSSDWSVLRNILWMGVWGWPQIFWHAKKNYEQLGGAINLELWKRAREGGAWGLSGWVMLLPTSRVCLSPLISLPLLGKQCAFCLFSWKAKFYICKLKFIPMHSVYIGQ